MQRPSTVPVRTSRAANSVVVPCGCSRGSGSGICPARAAGRGGCAPAPGSGSSRRWTAPPRGRAGPCRGRRRPRPLRQRRVVRALEGAQPMRLQAVSIPDPLHGAQARSRRRLAMARPVQCVTSPGGSEQVSASTSATVCRRHAAPCRAGASCRAADLRRPPRRSAAASATPPGG